MISRFAALLPFLFIPHMASATVYYVWNTTINVYGQSAAESGGHYATSTSPIWQNTDHPACGKGFYIDFSDKQLFVTALSAALTKKTVNVIYQDGMPEKLIHGYGPTTCKLVSVSF